MLPSKRNAVAIAAGAILFCVSGAALAQSPMPSDNEIKMALDQAYAKAQGVSGGKNADYIPVLAKVDPGIFGLALVTADGRVYTKGDIKSEVSIQSISKVFTLALVMDQQNPEAIENNIGVDATGQPFNSIVAVEQHKGQEENPLVNPGAITTTSMVKGDNRAAIWKSIIDYYSAAAGRPLKINAEVYKSESDTNQRNQAIAALMYAYGRIKANPQQATSIYTEQCSVSVNAKDLAMMAATLANGGRNPVTGKQVMKPENVPEVLAVMATAGLYDDAGKWLYKTGLPAKSGVGGGIIAVVPGKFGIAAISPPLDTAGNSVKAQAAIQAVDVALNANPYAVKPVTKQGYGGQK
ncbi:MAG TPA: glutaminase A [Rhizomicrobium sp.]|nr:glutaminase A [Rhizomicrobium sp.]